ncbi:MAG TPA: insulinase family protein, partial [Polyangia bacterium]|nr:insulinase family protein [Polyangia bacterium]
MLRSRILPSGLLVVLEEDPYAAVAGVVSVVRGGSSTDPPGREGIAHLVEHLTFRAIDRAAPAPDQRRSVGPTRWEELVRMAAPVNNGLTSPDAITFFEFAPPDQLPDLLKLEAARLGDPLAGVDEPAVAIERQVVASEFQLRDDPRAGLWAAHQLLPLIFSEGHPYARSPVGSAESRELLTLADAQAYALQNFRPERCTLLVSVPGGAIDMDTLVSMLPSRLSGDAGHPIARPPAERPTAMVDAPATPVLRRTFPLPVPQLWIAWTLPDGYGPFGAAETLLSSWLATDLDTDQLRQREPHIRHAAVSLVRGRLASALLVRVLFDDGADVDHLAEVVAEHVTVMATGGRAAGERLARGQALIATGLALGHPSQIERAIDEAQATALAGGPVVTWSEIARAVQAVSPDDVAQLASNYLGQHRRRAVLFQPGNATPPSAGRATPTSRSTAGALPSPLETFADAAAWSLGPTMEVPSPASLIARRRLPSGMTVVVARRRAPAVTAWMAFHGGYADADPPLLVEVARLARPDAVNAPLHQMLAGRFATPDATIETLEFQPADLTAGLVLLLQKATLPISKWPPRASLERTLAALTAELDPASSRASRAFSRALFGDHPFARPVLANDLTKVRTESAEDWISRVHDLRRGLLVVVGDVDVEQVMTSAAEIAAYLQASAPKSASGSEAGSVRAPAVAANNGAPEAPSAAAPAKPPAEIPAPPPPLLRPPGQEHVTPVITARAGPLTDIHLGCLLPPMKASERAAYELLRLTLQERLNAALRINRGEGYGVDVNYNWLRGGQAYLDLTTLVDASTLADALATVRRDWRRWGDG